MIYDIYNQQLRANQDLAGALKGEGIADTSLGTALIQLGLVGEKDGMGQRIYDTKGLATSLRGEGGGQGGKTGLYEVPLIANAVDPDGYLRSGARPRDDNGKPQLLPIGYRRIRRLTPIECERLQGFPDNWTKYGLTKDGKVIEISDTQRYKCCGNAVTTNVITDIGKYLIKAVLNNPSAEGQE